jgi:hypothetical protein
VEYIIRQILLAVSYLYLNKSLGTSQFGYPDQTYFNRVQQEMASKGVSEDTLDENPKAIADRLLAGGGVKGSKKQK